MCNSQNLESISFSIILRFYGDFVIIFQMRLNMLGQQEMFDPAYLAAQAAAVAGMTQGTPGARHPMFPFPPMYSTAYRASR